ncbi:MAG: hypothetical protein JSW31_14470 [Burkholderiales bacterium]|nr:MAG: hypothetical protein JSW31_14470 [Burkholderiales bacterium]
MASLRRATALLAALAAICAAGQAQTPPKRGLGLCPAGAASLDGYAQALCDGETALQAGDLKVAVDRFRFAATMPRAEASNELAWAGLAAAHCQSRDIDTGRQWAEHFSQARRLWLGELACEATGEDPRAQLSPFVRSRMCGDGLADDYAIVRGRPQAAYTLDLRARLRRIDDALAITCAGQPAAQPPARTAEAAKDSGATKTPSKRSRKRKNRATSGRTAGKPAGG